MGPDSVRLKVHKLSEHPKPSLLPDNYVDGTRLSGYVTAKENPPPRECGRCRWYEDDHCYHPLVKLDPDVPGDYNQPKPVDDKSCCNFYQAPKHPVLLILRHGSTILNQKKAFRGWVNVPLNEDGVQQAVEAREFLQDYPIKKIYCSPLDRAVYTAMVIEEGRDIQIIKTDDLMPWNVGFLTGQSKEENLPELRKYIDNPDEPVPDGESLNAFKERVFAFYDKLKPEFSPDNLILLVTHTSLVTALNQWVDENYAADEEVDESVSPGGIAGLYQLKDRLKIEIAWKPPRIAEYGS